MYENLSKEKLASLINEFKELIENETEENALSIHKETLKELYKALNKKVIEEAAKEMHFQHMAYVRRATDFFKN